MPHMKYFQAIAKIKNHYDDIVNAFQNEKYGSIQLEGWGIGVDEFELIKEEREVVRYLVGCQLDLVHEENAKKPSVEAANRCFNRHLEFIDHIFGCNEKTHKQLKTKFPNIVKEYLACRHYLFKFSCEMWLYRLPAEILTFENQYPDFEG